MADETTLPSDIDEAHRMIRELRKEAAGYRVKAKPYAEVFDQFNEGEQAYLLETIKGLANDDPQAAIELRDLSKRLLQDEFYDGLDLPVQEPKEKPGKLGKEGDDVSALTREELIALLDEREGKTKAELAKEREEAQRRADAEAIFAEIEEAGFERGSEGFMVALTLGQALATKGEDVDFKALSPRIHAAVGSEPVKKEETTETVEETKKIDPSTADVEGIGAPTASKVDWLAEAKAKGMSPMQAASERLAKRLGS